jgi:iron complex outermembrane receptor protein
MGMAAPAQVRPRAGRTVQWITGTLGWMTLIAAAFCQEARVRFSLPSQSLSAALLELGHQADISIAFNHALVADKRGEAIEGEMDVRSALARLLRPSGLQFEFVRPDLVRIVQAPPAALPVRTVRTTAPLEETQEVTVTARRRRESPGDVPLSVSVMNGDALAEANLNSVRDFTTQSPALQIRMNTSQKDRTIFIRGIGTITSAQSPEPSIATVIDGVVMGRSGQAMLDILDLDQIEVLSGPQGTLFGKNASAGVLNITTKAPTSAPSAFARLGIYTGEEYRITGGISGPLATALSGRLTMFASSYEGNVTNLYDGRTANGYRHEGARAKLLATPSGDLTLTLAADYTRSFEDVPSGAFLTGGSIPYCPSYLINPPAPNPCRPGIYQNNPALVARIRSLGVRPGSTNDQITNDSPNRTTDHNGGTSLQVEWNLSNDLLLTSITAWRQWRNAINGYDYDQLSSPIGFLPKISDDGRVRFEQASQELRLLSPKGGLVDFVAGAYFMHSSDRERYTREVTRLPSVDEPALLDSGTNHFGAANDNYALFGEMNFNVTSRMRVFAGYRQIWDEVNFYTDRVSTATASNSVPAVAPSFSGSGSHQASGWAGRAGVQFDLTPHVTAYASFSRGYKGPAFNVFFNMQSYNTRPIDAEVSDAYEAGIKSRWWDERIVLDVAAFSAEFHNYQASRTQFIAGSYVTNLTNAGSVATRGLEFDLAAAPTRGLTYHLSGLYDDAFIRHFSCELALLDCHVDGNPLPFAPRWAFNANQDYQRRISDSLELNVNVAYRWQSAMRYQYVTTSDLTEPAYKVWDLSLSLRHPRRSWSAGVLVKNVLDQSYSSYRAGGNLGGIVRYLPRDVRRYAGLYLQRDF